MRHVSSVIRFLSVDRRSPSVGTAVNESLWSFHYLGLERTAVRKAVHLEAVAVCSHKASYQPVVWACASGVCWFLPWG